MTEERKVQIVDELGIPYELTPEQVEARAFSADISREPGISHVSVTVDDVDGVMVKRALVTHADHDEVRVVFESADKMTPSTSFVVASDGVTFDAMPTKLSARDLEMIYCEARDAEARLEPLQRDREAVAKRLAVDDNKPELVAGEPRE